jgi:hypothetical protein
MPKIQHLGKILSKIPKDNKELYSHKTHHFKTPLDNKHLYSHKTHKGHLDSNQIFKDNKI